MSATSKLTVLQTEEHQAIPCDDEDTRKLLQEVNATESGANSLGLRRTNDGLTPGNFIGTVWLDDNKNHLALVVLPKQELRQMDYLQMYLRCIATDRTRVRKCIDIWPTQPLINAKEYQLPSVLIFAKFLHELNQLCSRHFRNHFRPKTSNLSGKIKGRIRMHLQIQRNLARGRHDRAWCTYQTIQQDILENRVLRAALEQSVKRLQQSESMLDPKVLQQLWRWMRACRTTLAHVPVTAVSRPQLRRLRTTGAFTHYRQALALARFILLSTGVDSPDEDDIEKPTFATPPFAIHSEKLFERYAHTVLKKEFSDIEPGELTPHEGVSVHPDYWVRTGEGDPSILDVKYKKCGGGKPESSDLYQVVAYSQHEGLRKKLGCDTKGDPGLYLVYPKMSDTDIKTRERSSVDAAKHIFDIKEIKSFSHPVQLLAITVPLKKQTSKDTPKATDTPE